MSIIHYATMITMVGSNAHDTSLGLYHGSLCYISGTPPFDGVTVIPTSPPNNPYTGSAQNIWYSGYLFDDQLPEASYDVELSALGTYGNMSNMAVKIANVDGLIHALRDVGFEFARAHVRQFVVINATFKQIWYGVVESYSHSLEEINVDCKGFNKDAHKEIPPNTVDGDIYPNARDSAYGKAIPIVFGYVNHAELVNVGGKSSPVTCNRISGIDYPVAACVSIQYLVNAGAGLSAGTATIPADSGIGSILVGDTVTILGTSYRCNIALSGGSFGITPGLAGSVPDNTPIYVKSASQRIAINVGNLPVSENQWLGKSVSIVRGGPRQAIQIQHNTAVSSSVVVLTLDGYFSNQDRTGYIVPVTHASPAPINTWWVQIIEASFPRVISDRPVYSIQKRDDSSTEILESYDEDLGKWVDIGNVRHSSSASSVQGGGGRPGFRIFSRDLDETRSKMMTHQVIRPSAVTLNSRSFSESGINPTTGITITTDVTTGVVVPELRDQNQNTSAGWVISHTAPTDRFTAITMSMDFYVDFNEIPFNSGFESISAALRMRAVATGTFGYRDVQVMATARVYGVDISGSSTNTQVNDGESSESPDIDSEFTGNAGMIYGKRVDLATPLSLYLDGIPMSYYGDDSVGVETNKVTQLKTLDISKLLPDAGSISPYRRIRVSVELVFDGHWNPANTHSFSMDVYEIVLIGSRELDVTPEKASTKVIGQMFEDTWGGRKTVGQPIQDPIDAIEYIIREYDERPELIDTGSFDDANLGLGNGIFGKQIKERVSSLDEIRRICTETDIWLVPTLNGTLRAVAPFRVSPFATPAVERAFEPADIIQGSLGEAEPVDVQNLYNEYELNWRFDPGPNKYTARLVIKDTDQAMPSETTFSGSTTSITFTDYTKLSSTSLIRIRMPLSSPVRAGDWIGLSGGAGGASFVLRVISGAAVNANALQRPNERWVFVDGSSVTLPANDTAYTTGTLVRYDSGIQTYKTMVTGIPGAGYSLAKQLHDAAALSRAITRTKTPLKLDFTWFGSAVDWGYSFSVDWPVVMAAQLVERLGYPKYRARFSVPMTSTNLDLYPGMPCSIDVERLTHGTAMRCWIERLGYNLSQNRIDIGVLYMLDGNLAVAP